MRIVVFGATGGVGRALLAEGARRGHEITALARDPRRMPQGERVTVLQGDVSDQAAVDRAVQGHEAVLCALGSHQLLRRDATCSMGTAHILRSMVRYRVGRLIACTSYGVGETRLFLPLPLRLLLRHPLFDKERQERLIRGADVAWVIARPAGLIDGEARGALCAAPSGPLPSRRVYRAHVATFMLDQMEQDGYLGQAVSLSTVDDGPSAPAAAKRAR